MKTKIKNTQITHVAHDHTHITYTTFQMTQNECRVRIEDRYGKKGIYGIKHTWHVLRGNKEARIDLIKEQRHRS